MTHKISIWFFLQKTFRHGINNKIKFINSMIAASQFQGPAIVHAASVSHFHGSLRHLKTTVIVDVKKKAQREKQLTFKKLEQTKV